MTAKEWRVKHPDLKGNIRDYADVLHLIVLSNLEVLNASMIESNICQHDRLYHLNSSAQKELKILLNEKNVVGINKINNLKEKNKKYLN